MIVGLISSYNEGRLLASALSSLLPAVDRVGVFEGPVGGDYPTVDLPFGTTSDVVYFASARRYTDPAQKRNYCLAWARSVLAKWIVWLDGDEVLLWPEYLRDMIERATQEQKMTGTAVGGFPLRVVELDGSVALANNRIVNTSAVHRFLHDASQVELANGMVAALPNEKICGAGGIPWGNFPMEQAADGTIVPAKPDSEAMQSWLGRHRPPVHGEPHVLHRSLLRDPARRARRLSDVEKEFFTDAEGKPDE